jgi:hypothetical protein
MINYKSMNIEKYIEEFDKEFVYEPLKKGGIFSWSQQDCGGANMIKDFLRHSLTQAIKERDKVWVKMITSNIVQNMKDNMGKKV